MTDDEIEALERNLSDPFWRVTSGELYKIKTADGKGVIPFHPRPEQIEILRELIIARDKTDAAAMQQCYPKARRLGCSTTIGVFVADCLAFCPDWTGSLIDQTQSDAAKKLNGIIKVALASVINILPVLVLEKSNDSTVEVSLNGQAKSSFFAGTKARGGSNDFLWVSEWGPIQFDDPKRSAEIRSGALPSARYGTIVVETTWKGGKGGDLWELLEPTINGKADDWRIKFFPWYLDPRNASDAQMDTEANAYFDKIAPRLVLAGVTLSDAQRRWWAAERRAQGIYMQRENPTFLDECWSSPIKGAIYAEKVERARAEGRICSMPVDGSNLVHTAWDLGSPENTAVWYFQIVGREIRLVDFDKGERGTLTQRVAYMLAKGYSYGKHYLPHDALQTERTGTTFAAELIAAGLPQNSVTCVPRTVDVWIGINHALEMFPALSFRSPQTDLGVDALCAYRMRTEGEGILSTNTPIHDWASHPSDAFRVMAEAHRAGLVAFKHTAAEVKADWYGLREKRKGAKPMRIGG